MLYSTQFCWYTIKPQHKKLTVLHVTNNAGVWWWERDCTTGYIYIWGRCLRWWGRDIQGCCLRCGLLLLAPTRLWRLKMAIKVMNYYSWNYILASWLHVIQYQCQMSSHSVWLYAVIFLFHPILSQGGVRMCTLIVHFHLIYPTR